jgi:hypothetical protein
MTSEADQDARRRAWTAARQAARSYSRDPSDLNEAKMRRAWLRLRDVRERAFTARARRIAARRAEQRARKEPHSA